MSDKRTAKEIKSRLIELIDYLPYGKIKYLVLSDEEYAEVTGLDPLEPNPAMVYVIGPDLTLRSRYQEGFKEAVEKEVDRRIGVTSESI